MPEIIKSLQKEGTEKVKECSKTPDATKKEGTTVTEPAKKPDTEDKKKPQ